MINRKSYFKLYRKLHKNQIKEKGKKYRRIHKKQISKQSKIYYQKNKEKILKRLRKYYKIHPEVKKIYYQKNRYNINKKNTVRNYNRYQIDLIFRLKNCVRAKINNILNYGYKSISTVRLLDCSIEFLKKHLESQFKPGMNWKNHGTGNNDRGMQEWHIDHIRPCKSFDLSKPEEQRKCFNYKNLQPLWAVENLKKGGIK